MRPRVLVARLDSDGDVLVSGPAVRAVAARADVVLLVGPAGRAAGELLPGVAQVWTWDCPWISGSPGPVDPADIEALVTRVRAAGVDSAVILTSYHQSALPLALVLRLAGVPQVGAASEDYPGSLLDVRHRLPELGSDGDTLSETERALSTAAACGFPLPAGDDAGLRVRRPLPPVDHLLAPVGGRPFLVIHPGASVPARAWAPARCTATVRALAAAGHQVVVTGGPGEAELTARVAAGVALDLGGRTSLAELASVLDRAEVVVVGNTGPAHLASAVCTPVVSLFAASVPAARWAPAGPHLLLGDQTVACAGCRARVCPVAGHPCLSAVEPAHVVAAVEQLLLAPAPPAQRPAPEYQDGARR